MPITVNSTAITFNNGTVQTTAAGSGTVTSIATSTGLSGGTITSTGTLVIAAPAYDTVGSYSTARSSGTTVSGGSNYSAGTGSGQICSMAEFNNDGRVRFNINNSTMSGTWKWMGGTATGQNGDQMGSACRVS